MRKLLTLASIVRDVLLAIAFACSALLPATDAQAHHAPGPIKFAAILTLTGPWASLGIAELRGLQLAVEQTNASGGVLTHKIELAWDDDGGDPKRAGDLAQRMANADTADILIGGSRTQTSSAIAAVAERARMPFIALGLSSRISQNRRWIFQVPPTQEHAVAMVFADMKSRGLRRIALLSEDSEFGAAGRAEVQGLTHPQGLGIRKFGIQLGLDSVYPPSDAGIAAQVALLKATQNIDAIFVFGAGVGPALVMKQLQRSGITLPVYQSHGVAAADFIQAAGPAAEGVRLPGLPMTIATQVAAVDARRAPLLEFVNTYQARFGERPSTFSGYAYDALLLGIDAIRRVTSSDFEMMRRALELTQGYVGISGTYRMWPDRHIGLDERAMLLLEIRDGEFRIVQ